jgi:hypothetical protein
MVIFNFPLESKSINSVAYLSNSSFVWIYTPEFGLHTFNDLDDNTSGAKGGTAPDALPKVIILPRRARQSNESCQVSLPTYTLDASY